MKIPYTLKAVKAENPSVKQCKSFNYKVYEHSTSINMVKASEINNKTDYIAELYNISNVRNPEICVRNKYTNEILFTVEVEVSSNKAKSIFNADKTWKYSAIRIPAEKDYHFTNKIPCFFIKVDKETDICIIVDGRVMKDNWQSIVANANHNGVIRPRTFLKTDMFLLRANGAVVEGIKTSDWFKHSIALFYHTQVQKEKKLF